MSVYEILSHLFFSVPIFGLFSIYAFGRVYAMTINTESTDIRFNSAIV